LAQGDYHKVADHTLEGILDVLETIGDEYDMDGYDVEYSVSHTVHYSPLCFMWTGADRAL
jgi:Frataxin-like domain